MSKPKTYSPDDDEKKKKRCEEQETPVEDPEEDEEEQEPDEEKPEIDKKKAPNAVAISVYDRLWAIKTEKLFELAHWPEKIKAGLGEMFAEMERNFDCEPRIAPNGTAIINIFGVLDQRSSLMQWIFGGCSTEKIYSQIEALVARQEIKQIVLNFATPGGAVDGIENLANLIYASRDKKPIIGFANSACFSGGTWLATACSKFYMASQTAMAGSVGVVTAHQDVSGAEEMFGIKTTEITAGKYKRIDSQYKPLSDEGKTYLQERVDYVYTIFVDAVARNRGKTSQEVLEKMADGKILLGGQAVEAGLADGILSLEDYLKGESMPEKVQLPAPQAAQATTQSQINLSEEYLAQNAPAILADIKKKSYDEGVAAGAKAERERIQAIEENTMPGFEKMAAACKFDGKTTGDQFAIACFKKQKEDGISLSAMRADNRQASAAPTATTAAADDPKAAQISAIMEGMAARKVGK